MCDKTSAPRGRAIIQAVEYETCGECGKPIKGTGKTIGGIAIWVVKDFVRAKKRVPFSNQWQALCEEHGFKLVCRHQAMLVAHHGEQDDIFGETKQLKTEKKSFFRRLAEKRGSPEINHEDVLCLIKIA